MTSLRGYLVQERPIALRMKLNPTLTLIEKFWLWNFSIYPNRQRKFIRLRQTTSNEMNGIIFSQLLESTWMHSSAAPKRRERVKINFFKIHIRGAFQNREKTSMSSRNLFPQSHRVKVNSNLMEVLCVVSCDAWAPGLDCFNLEALKEISITTVRKFSAHELWSDV